MNPRSAVTALVLIAALAATASCTGDKAGSRPPQLPDARPAVVHTSLLNVRTSDLPPLTDRRGLPHHVPDLKTMPDLLDDPPGRALLAVNPEITTSNGPVAAWSENRIAFFGEDGRWRLLDMGGLGLPVDSTYVDTYGAGQLSPDGTQWLGPTRDGVLVLDLETGRVDRRRVAHPGAARWSPDGARVISRYDRRPTDGSLSNGELVATRKLRPQDRVAVVVTDARTGTTVADLTYRRGVLQREMWLDDDTMLIARTPYFVVWEPRTGELFRATAARHFGGYWDVTVAP